MNTTEFVDNLFVGYEENDAMIDFKEELKSNLDARILHLEKQGMDFPSAFHKASGELGDVSLLADEISLKKKQEVFENMYMKTRSYISTKRMVAYLCCVGVILFGLIAGTLGWLNSHIMASFIGVMLPFGIAPIATLIVLALTQETARYNPMKITRAIIYAVSISGFLFGLMVFALTYFGKEAGLPAAVATLIPFCLPCILLLAFLILTEKNRNKPWVEEQQKIWLKQHESTFSDPTTAEKFGLICGALWIFSFALFLAFGFIIGFRYSWVIFIASIGFQLLIQSQFVHKQK